MKDKEKKIIEELAQDIANNCPDIVDNGCGSKPCYVCLAERLAKDHYQKIDKDKVVLPKSEYDKLTMLAKECIDWRTKHCNTNMP